MTKLEKLEQKLAKTSEARLTILFTIVYILLIPIASFIVYLLFSYSISIVILLCLFCLAWIIYGANETAKIIRNEGDK